MLIDDDIVEINKLLGVEIDTDALPEHVTVSFGEAEGEIVILDDDVTTISVEPPEPAEEGEDVVVTLRLDKLVSFDFTLGMTLFSGTATRGDDFTFSERPVFSAGDTETTVRIPTVEDGLEEDDETFTLVLVESGLHNAINLPDEFVVTLTIQDDDHAPVVETPSRLTTWDYTTEITTLSATDGDGDDLTWEITGGDDQGLFDLTEDGALSFTTLQSFDSPGDSNRDGTYHVHVRVTDGFNPVDHRLTIDLEAAPPPRSLSARVADDGVVLTWLPPLEAADSVDGYEIHRRRANRAEREFAVLVSDTTNTETTYTDTTATVRGVRYTYRVKAIRGGQRSGWSRFATAMRVERVTTPTLVGNLGQPATATAATITQQYAMGFRLGRHGQGYEISSVLIDLAAAPTDLTVSLWISSHPGHTVGADVAQRRVFDFENPSAFAVGLNRFTAPAGAYAYPNVNYWIVLSGHSSLSIRETASDDEDAGGETGSRAVEQLLCASGDIDRTLDFFHPARERTAPGRGGLEAGPGNPGFKLRATLVGRSGDRLDRRRLLFRAEGRTGGPLPHPPCVIARGRFNTKFRLLRPPSGSVSGHDQAVRPRLCDCPGRTAGGSPSSPGWSTRHQ